MDVQRGDYVTGWFGTALVTDVGHGFITDAATDEQIGPVDDLIRIKQGPRHNPSYTYIYQSDIKEIL